MGVRWENVAEAKRSRFDRMGEAQKFECFLAMQAGAPYGWGEENPRASDCSGAVCMSLFAATGLLVRTTADDLFRRAFTVPNPSAGSIRAAFYVTREARPHGDRTAPAGTATHVAAFVGDNVVLNSERPVARLRRLEDVSRWHLNNGHDVVIRGLDRAALEGLARAGAVWGLDGIFSHYFDTGDGEAAPQAVARAKAPPMRTEEPRPAPAEKPADAGGGENSAGRKKYYGNSKARNALARFLLGLVSWALFGGKRRGGA